MDKSCAARYEKLATKRDYFLDRARECSELTLPSLLPPEGFTPSSDLYTPYQSVGARGVNNLASKLLLLLLPPNVPFFRLMTDKKTENDLSMNPEIKQQIEVSLSQIERSVMDEVEAQSIRVSVFESLKHLLVTGNVLIHLPKEGSLKVFPLTNYVVRRDPNGEPVEIIVKEMVSKESVPEGFYDDGYDSIDPVNGVGHEDEIPLFTKIVRSDDKYIVYQEIENKIVGDSYGEYPKDLLPWLALRMVRIDGEDYGRSFTEEVLGDIRSLEALTQALVESAAASSKLVFLVRPNATTRKSDIADANNGDVVTGSREDVNVLQTEKYNDMRVVLDSVQRIEERLKFAFLLNESVQRQAERVTATEIKFMADEMEAALSGVYSLLSVEFQLPLVSILMKRMETKGLIPTIPKGSVTPVIVTGTAALGRGNDLQKLKSFLSDLIQLTGATPQAIQRINSGDLIRRLAAGHGIEVQGLLRSEEEMAAQMQQAQQQAMMQQAMQEGIKGAAGPAAKQIVEQGIG
tara:strand:+ start:7197 stop:8750 length:1554 start_codon:yes stop_codon:yes gene_type:complete